MERFSRTSKIYESTMPLTLKIVLIGDSGVGKTAVMRRFLGELFDPTFIMTTAGETLKRKRITVKEHHVELELWDAPGNESFRTDVALYMKNAKAVVVFYDVTNEKSFEDIDNWLRFIPHADSSQKPSTFIIGNKTDKKPRCVTKGQAEHNAKQRASLYFETSAKDNSLEHFNQIFHQIIEDVLDKSPGITINSGSMTANQRPPYRERSWYQNCVLL